VFWARGWSAAAGPGARAAADTAQQASAVMSH